LFVYFTSNYTQSYSVEQKSVKLGFFWCRWFFGSNINYGLPNDS